jgi:hypothetical protein
MEASLLYLRITELLCCALNMAQLLVYRVTGMLKVTVMDISIVIP